MENNSRISDENSKKHETNEILPRLKFKTNRNELNKFEENSLFKSNFNDEKSKNFSLIKSRLIRSSIDFNYLFQSKIKSNSFFYLNHQQINKNSNDQLHRRINSFHFHQ